MRIEPKIFIRKINKQMKVEKSKKRKKKKKKGKIVMTKFSGVNLTSIKIQLEI